jgi:hypothetical protein
VSDKAAPEPARSPDGPAAHDGPSVGAAARTPADAVLALQTTVGNAAVTSLLRTSSARLLQRQDTAATMSPEERRSRRQFERVRSLFNRGRFARALRLFERLSDSPHLPQYGAARIAFNVALCKAHLGDLEDAGTWVHYYEQSPREAWVDPSPEELRRMITRIGHGRPATEPGQRPRSAEDEAIGQQIAQGDIAAGRIPALQMTEDARRRPTARGRVCCTRILPGRSGSSRTSSARLASGRASGRGCSGTWRRPTSCSASRTRPSAI